MMYPLAIFILLCGLFEVYLCQPKSDKEAELKKLGNYHAKLKSYWTNEDELVRIAKELVRLDEYEEAIAFFTKAIKNKPTRHAFYQDRGHCYSRMGKWREAYSDLKESWMLYRRTGKQTNVTAGELRGLCSDLMYKNMYNEAVLCYTEAIHNKETPEYVTYKRRGDCYKALKNYDSAELDYREALKKYPKDGESRTSLIRVLFLHGKIEQAVAEMRFMNDVDLGRLGDEFCNREGKYIEGIHCYTEASNQSHLDPEYYMKRGSCYENMNKMDEAVNDYRNALQKNPKDGIILEKLVLALFKMKRIDEATTVIRGLNDDDLACLEERFVGTHNCEYGIPVIIEEIERNPDDASKYNARGRCYLAMKNLDSALTDFERATKLSPSNTEYLFNQIKTLFKMGRSAEAVEKLVGLDAAQLQSMGDGLVKDGKYVEALECFTEAIRKNPDDRYTHQKAAECYWKNNNFEMAKLEMERAINLLPRNNQRRIDLETTWCENLVNAGKFPEARLALKNFEPQYGGYGKFAMKAAELREKMFQMEQEKRGHVSSE